MNRTFYTYTIELETTNHGSFYQLECNTEELLDIVLRCAYISLTIIKKQKVEVSEKYVLRKM